ncbi:MAG: serine/threonine protein phosphatase [Proteobacteria bacterium]|nr:serine/threonine protein phosphatase [Pseudomonadota bacterium]
MEKIFAIGDIHGCLHKLKSIMANIDIDAKNDTLIFIGDYIDRGPDPKGVVDFVLGLRESINHIIFLKGNHEQMFLDYLRDDKYKGIFLANGGGRTLSSYGFVETAEGAKVNVPENHMQFFKSLLPYYETDDYIFVHAGLRPDIPLEEQDTDDLIWIRYEFIRSSHDFGKTVVFGHTPLSRPLIESNKIGIDTGAVFGGSLTCVELPEVRIHQA